MHWEGPEEGCYGDPPEGCPNVGCHSGMTVKACEAMCDGLSGCNALNYATVPAGQDGAPGGCCLRACPQDKLEHGWTKDCPDHVVYRALPDALAPAAGWGFTALLLVGGYFVIGTAYNTRARGGARLVDNVPHIVRASSVSVAALLTDCCRVPAQAMLRSVLGLVQDGIAFARGRGRAAHYQPVPAAAAVAAPAPAERGERKRSPKKGKNKEGKSRHRPTSAAPAREEGSRTAGGGEESEASPPAKPAGRWVHVAS